jgi:Fe2+ or Zn2+ uptake regulation protein
MLEHLFGSKTRLKLLRTFFRKPEEAFYVRELTRILDVQINAVRRELEILVSSGLVVEVDKDKVSKDKGNGSNLRRYYSLNKESILYPEMHALLVKAQVLGEQKFSDEIQNKAECIKLFILTGQFTSDKRAPSDILLVGNIKERAVLLIVKKYEKEFGFEIRYTLMTEDEFVDRRHVMDKFLFSMFDGKHLKVVNKLGV